MFNGLLAPYIPTLADLYLTEIVLWLVQVFTGRVIS